MKLWELHELIFEELEAALKELNEAPKKSTTSPAKKRKRASIGKKWTDAEKTSSNYTSRGTVPVQRNRKMTPAQIQKRHEIGQKLLNALRARGPGSPGKPGKSTGAKLWRALRNHAKKHGWNPSDRKTIYSFVWAMATDMALTGRDFVVGSRQKKPTSKKDKPKNRTERPPPSAKNKKQGVHHVPKGQKPKIQKITRRTK
jgi:hypothetical protein